MSILPREVVIVEGPDAFAFLQSLVSQDVTGMVDGEVRCSLLLLPQGKVDSAFRVVRVGDAAWLDVAPRFGEPLAAALRRYLIRVRAALTAQVEGWGLVAWREPEPPDVPLPPTVRALPPWATGVGGADYVGPVADLGGVAAGGLDVEEYEAERVRAGVPALGAELTPAVIPQEAGLEHRCISFTKGCFLGQELVCRIDSRGHVNRHLRHLVPRPEVVLPVGAPVRAGGREVGTVTSAIGGLGLGYVRREVSPGAEVTVDGVDGAVSVAAISAP